MPAKLVDVFLGEADVRGAYGGRGSGKTRTFAKMSAVKALMWSQAGEEGIIMCARQFMKTLKESSFGEIKAAINETEWLKPHFDMGEDYLRTIDKKITYSFIGLDRNISNVKSTARLKLAWVDEAEPVTDEAWTKLIPTLREGDSELWVTWNPESKRSATNKRFMGSTDPRTKIVEINWRDNPWFPDILKRARLKDKIERPEQYGHIWEGEFKAIYEGAYYAAQLTRAKEEGRIGRVAADSLMTIRLVADIGGTGARADSFVFWAVQFVGREVRVLDHYEAVGQELGEHLGWLRRRGYTPDRAQIWLPHDGANHDKVYRVTYESAFTDAGYDVTVIPNQGAGAASARIEAARRLFPSCWFNEATTEGGREALAAYHEKRDEERGIGLGPDHGWPSHSADAFGLMAVIYEQPSVKKSAQIKLRAFGAV